MSVAFIFLVYLALLVGLPLGYLTAGLITTDHRRRR